MATDRIDDLGYLLHHLVSVLDRQSDLVLKDRLDIGFSQFKILMALQHREGVQQKEIARKLGQTEASVSRQIALLCDAGFITAKRSPADRRQHVTVLTPKGTKLIDMAIRALNNYHQPVFNRLSHQQQAELKQMLKVMLEQASARTH